MTWTQEWLELDPTVCSVARTVALVGDKWTFLLLREVNNGVRRFEPLQRRLGAPRAVLAARLAHLVDAGLLERAPYREAGQRTRFEYRLTQRGADLRPVLVALMQYGDQHLAEDAGPPVELRHRGCGADVHLALVCADGHVLSGRDDLAPRPGSWQLVLLWGVLVGVGTGSMALDLCGHGRDQVVSHLPRPGHWRPYRG